LISAAVAPVPTSRRACSSIEQLEDADAAAIPVVRQCAHPAPIRTRRRSPRPRPATPVPPARLDAAASIRANPPHQPLRQHADQDCWRRVRLDAQVEQSRDRAGGVVGVQRAENQVPGQRRLDRHRRRLASRISPTMMTSGSCRSTLRRPLAKVMPFLSLTCVWLMPRADTRSGPRA
jgi:hypothetical protein